MVKRALAQAVNVPYLTSVFRQSAWQQSIDPRPNPFIEKTSQGRSRLGASHQCGEFRVAYEPTV